MLASSLCVRESQYTDEVYRPMHPIERVSFSGIMGASEGGTSLLETPPYVIAVVFLFFLVVTLGFEWVRGLILHVCMMRSCSMPRVTNMKQPSGASTLCAPADPTPYSACTEETQQTWSGGRQPSWTSQTAGHECMETTLPELLCSAAKAGSQCPVHTRCLRRKPLTL